MDPSPFGIYLRHKRVSAGKSIREVARALGISHVYLGDVERGKRRTLPENYWPALIEAVPGITKRELEAHAAESAPIDPISLHGPVRDIAVALARRLRSRDLTSIEIQQLLCLLNGDSKQ